MFGFSEKGKFYHFFKIVSILTINKPVISIIYIVAHTWPSCFAQILMDGVNPQERYFQKSTNISEIVQHMNVFVCFSTKLKSLSSK